MTVLSALLACGHPADLPPWDLCEVPDVGTRLEIASFDAPDTEQGGSLHLSASARADQGVWVHWAESEDGRLVHVCGDHVDVVLRPRPLGDFPTDSSWFEVVALGSRALVWQTNDRWFQIVDRDGHELLEDQQGGQWPTLRQVPFDTAAMADGWLIRDREGSSLLDLRGTPHTTDALDFLREGEFLHTFTVNEHDRVDVVSSYTDRRGDQVFHWRSSDGGEGDLPDMILRSDNRLRVSGDDAGAWVVDQGSYLARAGGPPFPDGWCKPCTRPEIVSDEAGGIVLDRTDRLFLFPFTEGGVKPRIAISEEPRAHALVRVDAERAFAVWIEQDGPVARVLGEVVATDPEAY